MSSMPKLRFINEYCGSGRGTHVGMRSRDKFWKKYLEGMQKNDFQTTGRFIPDRLKIDPKSTFSLLVSLPQMF